VDKAQDPSLNELEKHVAPEKVLDRLAEDESNAGPEGSPGAG